MTTQEKTIVESAREIAQKLVDLELTRKDVVEQQKALKEELQNIWDEHEEVDTFFDVNQGTVYQDLKTKYSIPDGLSEEVFTKVKNPEKLSQEIIETYIKTSLSLNKKGVKAMREGSPDLANLIVQDDVQKVAIKV